MNTKSMRRKKSSLSEVKVAVIGAPGVGKSALSVRFLTRRYIGEYDHQSETRYKHEVLVDNEPILYEILDTCPKIDAVTGKSETFGSLKQRCVRVALGMESRGVKSEHYVTLCSKNTLDSVIPWIATTFLGAKIGALDPNLSSRDMKHLLTLAGPRIIFVEESSLRLIEQSLEGTDMSTEIVVLGSSSKYSTLAEFLKPSKSESVFRPRGADPDEVGIVFFSSGTTGLPKGICWSHRNVVQAFQCLGECNMDCRAVLYFSTLYWVSAVGLLVDSFSVGGYRVLISQFDAETTFKAIDNYKITFIFAAPGILTELANFIVAGRYNTESLKNFLTGGTPIPPEKLLKARETFKDTNVTVCYGMTEFAFTSLYDKQDGIFKNKPRSCGKLIPGVSLKVVDLETHQCLGPNQSGEIRLKSGFMMVGYLRQDFTNAFDEEGYLKTGDVGYYDEDECLYVVDRIKDMFKYKAWHIVPSSLESVLLQHPDVKEAIVYGIPHEEHGDLPAACVVLKDRSTVTDEEVKIFFNKRVLEREHLIGGLKFLKQIPKTPTGKVMRKELRNSMIKSN